MGFAATAQRCAGRRKGEGGAHRAARAVHRHHRVAALLATAAPLGACSTFSGWWDSILGKKDETFVDQPADKLYNEGLYTLNVKKQPKDAARANAAFKFFKWALDEGQKQATELDYVPLPDALAKQIEAGAPADLFISADLAWMKDVHDKNLTVGATEKPLLGGSYGIGKGGLDFKAVLFWLLVGVPLGWGVWNTVQKALVLFH